MLQDNLVLYFMTKANIQKLRKRHRNFGNKEV